MKYLICSYAKFHQSSYNFRRFTASASTCKLVNNSDPDHTGLCGVKLPGLLILLQICARDGLLLEGKSCHGLAITGGTESDIRMSNVLINFYSRCGCLCSSQKVFHRMTMRSIVSYNTIISAYAKHAEHEKAVGVFVEMHRKGAMLTEFTLSSVICACAAKLLVCEGKQLHAVALKTGFDSNVYVGTAMLDVYAKSSMVTEAYFIFDKMLEKSSVTWSSMIAGYVQNGLYEEALKLFHVAQKNDLERTKFTISAGLSASAGLAAIIEGAQQHAIVIKTGFDTDIYVSTCLIDVYSRCGHIKNAFVIFQNTEKKVTVVWNAMISGFSKHGLSNEALILFEKMQQVGLHPNEITYISLLSACAHAGLVDKGRGIFNLLIQDKNLQPNVFHYSCMVDVLGRAGLIEEAWNLICSMPFKATVSIWGSLLGSCKIHGHLKLAKVAAERLFEMEPENAANHLLLSNMYAAKKRWGEFAMLRKTLKESGAKRELGQSWIEVQDKVHTFTVGQVTHPRIREVYCKLEELENEMKMVRYVAESDCDVPDVGKEESSITNPQ